MKKVFLGFIGIGVGCLASVLFAQQSQEVSYGWNTWRSVGGKSEGQIQVDNSPKDESLAGEIFGVPVPLGNYYFAKRVARLFPPPWGAADLPAEKLEDFIWEQLILHYVSFQKGVSASEEKVNELLLALLKNQEITWTPQSDPEAYQKWVRETLQEEPEFLENQIRYLVAIRTLKDQVLKEAKVSVTPEELKEEFFNEKNHVGGEMVTFPTREEALAFYEKVKTPSAWEKMKSAGRHNVRPVSLMTLEAYIDLWSIPKEQMDAFHAMEVGSIGAPMPFGRDWCVYRLGDKRTGDLKDFPAQEESYRKQVEIKKRYDALKKWIDELKQSAGLKIYGASLGS